MKRLDTPADGGRLMLRATLKSLLARKLRLVAVRAGRGPRRHVRVRARSCSPTPWAGRSTDSSPASTPTPTSRLGRPRSTVPTLGRRAGATHVAGATVQPVGSVTGWPSAPVGPADGARVIGANGKVVDLDRAAAARAATGPATAPLWSCARAAGPPADDEIAINAALAQGGRGQGRRPGRRADPAAAQQTFTLVGIFGYGGGRDRQGGSQIDRVHPAGGAAADARRSRTCSPHRGRQGQARVSDDTACVTGWRPTLGDGYQVKTGEAARRRGRDSFSTGAEVLQQHPDRFRRRGVVRGASS